MELVWKLVVVILNLWFTVSNTFHEVLHCCQAVRGTGTAYLKAKLIHQLAALREEVLYMIFLDLQKSYNALDRDIPGNPVGVRCGISFLPHPLEILEQATDGILRGILL